MRGWSIAVALAACSDPPSATGEPEVHVVATYPSDHQLDVPLGAQLVVAFSAVPTSTVALLGPAGPVAATTEIVGKTIVVTPAALDPGTPYQLSVDGSPLVEFTSRDDRPHSGPPRLIAIAGSDPARPGEFRPLVETSTLQLVFSEPLDPRTIEVGDAISLVDTATAESVPVRLFAEGIHVSLDPIDPLVAGDPYELRLGAQLLDLSGEALAPVNIPFAPLGSLGRGTTRETLRMRDGENKISIAHPLIGSVGAAMNPGAMASDLADPAALGGPIAFAIPRGQRLTSGALAISLAGAIPSGLTTGDIQIELLADANGRIDHSAFGDPDVQLVDLTLDLGLFATDPTGNAVLAQTVLGVQVGGIATAEDGTLAIEGFGAMDIDLLGVAHASANLVLAFATDPDATTATDSTAPALVTTGELDPETGVALLFDEPIDLERARAGGIRLVDAAAQDVPIGLELQGAALVVRPRARLAAGAQFELQLADIADAAGNSLVAQNVSLATPALAAPTTPVTVLSASPGTACALAAGHCVGGQPTDTGYLPFTLGALEPVDLSFDQPVDPASLVLGAACDQGSVRVETVDADDRCLAPVPGGLVARASGLAFVPDAPWLAGTSYRVVLHGGADATCSAGEVCGRNHIAASFDPLAGTSAGGPDLAIGFTGAPSAAATRLFAEASSPAANRAAVRITGVSGIITSATFSGADCVPATPEVESCMNMTGAMPADLGTARHDCALPDGTTAETCVPVALSAQELFSSSMAMTAAALGIPIAATTGTTVLRVREPADGPLEGFIVDRDGTPTMVVALDLYMDAPDMALPIGTHDLHSKPLSVVLTGPVTFRPDGRIAITLANTADMPIAIAIAALGLTGGIQLVVPAGEMKLELLSRRHR